MCSVHCDVSGRARLAALVAFGGVVVAGCATGPTGGGTTSGSAAPVIVNQQEIVQARRNEYRATGMMEQGVADTTVVELLVDMLGEVEDVKVAVSSGNDTVDQAALRVARVHRFEPARNRGNAVPVWVSLSISFEPGLCDTAPRPRRIEFPPNPADFRGVRDEVTVALLIDLEGLVREAKIETSSGSPDFDRAVLGAARKWRYTPGTLDCEPAEKWMTQKFDPGKQMDERR